MSEQEIHPSIEEDKKAILMAKLKPKPINKSIIGLGVAMTAFFVILLWQNANLTNVVSRRSPFMEYTICYNERDSAERKAYNELLNLYISDRPADPQIVVVKTKAYNDAAMLLTEATDLNSADHCPGLEVLKDR